MNIKVWSTALLILCLCPAAIAQKANRYLEKPLPQGWGRDVSHAIPGDDNLFSGQIPPIDDKWWKAFDDPMLDSLITVASTQNSVSYTHLRAHGDTERSRMPSSA